MTYDPALIAAVNQVSSRPRRNDRCRAAPWDGELWSC